MSIQYNPLKLSVKASDVEKSTSSTPETLVHLSQKAQTKTPSPRQKATAKSEASSDVKFWDRTAFAYDLAMRKGDAGVAEAAGYIASFAKPTDIVLDAACGTGAFACEIAPRVGFVAACDLSQKMLERAEAKAKKFGIENIAFANRDITVLDFGDDTFDVAIAANVLHLLEEPRKAVDELVRVTRPDGYIVVPNYFLDGKPADVRFAKAAEAIGFPLKNDWSKDDLLKFLDEAVLEVVESKTFAGARPLCVAVCKARNDTRD